MDPQIVVDSRNQPEFTSPSIVPDTFPSNLKPWEFRSGYAPNETRKAYARFRAWLEMPGGTTFTAYSKAIGVSLPVISRMSTKYQWRVRAAAFHEFSAIFEAERERKERQDAHLEKLEQFRSRGESVGNALIAASAKLLQSANKAIDDIAARGDVLDSRLIAGALSSAARCSEAGRALAAQSLGIEALMSGLDDADGTGDEYS